MTLHVTVTDVEIGDTDTVEVPEGDYLLVCHEPCHLHHTNAYANGTHVTHHQRPKGRTVTCNVCGRSITDDEACYPHNRGCYQLPWCGCDNVTCPECCWECAAVEGPA